MVTSDKYSISYYRDFTIIPYGSTIRGTNTEYSDFDVLVICDYITFMNYIYGNNNLRKNSSLSSYIRAKYLFNKRSTKIDINPVIYYGDYVKGNNHFKIFKMYDKDADTIITICPDYNNYILSNIYGIYGENLLNYIRKRKVSAYKDGLKRPSIYIEIEAVKSYTDIDVHLY